MPLAPFTGVLGRKNASHLLRRATFGATKNDIDAVSLLTPAQAITQLFQSTPEPLPPIDTQTGATWIGQPLSPANSEDPDLQGFFKYWWLGITLGQGATAGNELAYLTREKIVFFLHSHFTTIQETVGNSRALYYQNVLFRRFALDSVADPLVNFKELTKKVCIDNAMIVLLDGRLNVKGRPNENFARELLELYTIGKGLVPSSPGPGDYTYFTEQDVQEAAKALSGWDLDTAFSTLDTTTGLPRAKVKMTAGNIANQHDNTVKQFSARFGNAIITPDPALLAGSEATEASVLDELDQLIELIYAQEETPKNICRKIYRFYVYHEITDTLDNTIIAEMVNTFESNNYKIEPVIRDLLTSQHFYDSANATVDDDNVGAIIKSPLDLVTGTLRFFEYQMPDYQTSAAELYMKAEGLIQSMNFQGMNFVNPFDVAGYEAYHQFPLFNRHWISANTLTQRYKLIFDVMRTDNMSMESVSIDLLTFMQQRFSANAMDPDAFIRELITYLFPMSEETTEITTERLNYFKAQFYKLGTGLPQGSLVFWQFSWSNANTIPASNEDARGMLQDLINALLQSPEYQLM